MWASLLQTYLLLCPHVKGRDGVVSVHTTLRRGSTPGEDREGRHELWMVVASSREPPPSKQFSTLLEVRGRHFRLGGVSVELGQVAEQDGVVCGCECHVSGKMVVSCLDVDSIKCLEFHGGKGIDGDFVLGLTGIDERDACTRLGGVFEVF